MKPIEFEEQNTISTSSNPNIKPLPCRIDEGQVISCWELSPEEIDIINKTGKLYVSMLSESNVIPILLTVNKNDLFIYQNELQYNREQKRAFETFS